MEQTRDPAQLVNFSRALINGISSVFPLPQVSGHNDQDLISKKKLESGEGQWEVRKEFLGWIVDGATRFIKLERKNQSAIDAELQNIVRITKGVQLKRIKKLIGKIRHAATAVPTGKQFMTPITKILQVKTRIVWWKYFPAAKQALKVWRTQLKEAGRETLTATELVMGDPEFLAWVDTSGEGVGVG